MATMIDAAGITVELQRGGSGPPLLVIHGELGVPGWLDSFAQLAERYDVIVPSLPGYGRSTRPDWIMGVHDLAAWITWFARDLDLDTSVNVIGCGAMGLKPEHGEIFDYFLEGGLTGLRRAFHRPEQSSEFMRYWGTEWTLDQADLVEQHREMTCRLAWKPYMHSLSLRHLLPGITTPTLLVWGREDAITPIERGELYQRAIPHARLTIMDNCGHMPEMEHPVQFAQLVENFLAG